jgi:hypothetical protein
MKSLLSFLTFFVFATTAVAGPRVIGNGGDIYALQFASYADRIVKYLQVNQDDVPEINADKLEQIVADTKIESTTEKLVLNGYVKAAINYPDKKLIVINQDQWSNSSDRERSALVLHEYLSLMGIEDAKYAVSKRVLNEFEKTKNSAGGDSSWWVCEGEGMVLNSVEHRKGMDDRGTDVVMLLGVNVLKGELEYKSVGAAPDSGKLNLKSSAANLSFTGKAIFWNLRVSLKGTLDLFGTKIPINQTLECHENNIRNLPMY